MIARTRQRPTEAARLLAVLETFTSQQTLWIRAGNCAQALAVRRRAAPVVARLRELGPSALSGLRDRLGELAKRQRENLTALAARRSHLLAERERLRGARERVRAMGVYASSSGQKVRSRLNALG